ncbi:hypothetical protein [Bradyrhizobium valentinum]|uniref:hypothetical protein n=1 Tax=Bradyrhizobium valentinum TaxID=1518501 RepID=UPI0007160D60|nr:hypothetical protein [Bradyrhizobium valentinum]KRR00773.1 hypothetical protein CQ10_03140 [Bradyrhizobium valentinum]
MSASRDGMVFGVTRRTNNAGPSRSAMAGLELFIILQPGFSPVSSSNQMSAIAAASLQPSQQRRRVAWPFAATMLSASLLGIGLAFCARALLPAWGIEGASAFFLPNDVVCSNGNSSTSPQTTRMDE